MYAVEDKVSTRVYVCDDAWTIMEWAVAHGVKTGDILDYLAKYAGSLLMITDVHNRKHFSIQVYDGIAQDLLGREL